MTLNKPGLYSRYALKPTVCSKCGRNFVFEQYTHKQYYTLLSPFFKDNNKLALHIENVCKKCESIIDQNNTHKKQAIDADNALQCAQAIKEFCENTKSCEDCVFAMLQLKNEDGRPLCRLTELGVSPLAWDVDSFDD